MAINKSSSASRRTHALLKEIGEDALNVLEPNLLKEFNSLFSTVPDFLKQVSSATRKALCIAEVTGIQEQYSTGITVGEPSLRDDLVIQALELKVGELGSTFISSIGLNLESKPL